MLAEEQILTALHSLNLTNADVLSRFRGLFESFMDDYAKAHGKHRWVDKTPGYATILPFIDLLFDGNVKYVLLVRHPLDCVLSLEAFSLRFPHFRRDDPEIRALVRLHGCGRDVWARYWAETYDRILSFLRTTPDRCRLVRYEELVATPDKVLADVATFFGEDHTLLNLEDAFTNLGSKGYQDDKIFQTRHIHNSSVGGYRSVPELRRLWPLVRNTAAQYGYAEPAFEDAIRETDFI
jgi:hypothetical protein